MKFKDNFEIANVYKSKKNCIIWKFLTVNCEKSQYVLEKNHRV